MAIRDHSAYCFRRRAFGTALWAGFEPRCNAREQAAHGLQISKLATIRHVPVGRFHRHLCLEVSLTESLQNGVRDPGQDLNPVFTIVGLSNRRGFRTCRDCGEGPERNAALQEFPTVHTGRRVFAHLTITRNR